MRYALGIDIWHTTSLLSTFLIWLFFPTAWRNVKWIAIPWFLLIQYSLFNSFYMTPGTHDGFYFAQAGAAAQSAILLVLIPLISLFYWHWVPLTLLSLGTIDAIHLLFGGVGVLTGPSFDTAMLAVFVPLLLNEDTKWKYLVAALWAAAIIKVGGSTAYVILLGQLGVWVISKRRWWLLFAGSLVAIAVVGIAYVTHGTEIWNDNNRLDMWNSYLFLFKRTSVMTSLVGAGLGSFEWIGTLINVNGFRYVWMHNDWLQILFETGFIGLAVAITLTVWSLWRFKKNTSMLALTTGFILCMIFYSPLRFVYGQVLACWILLKQEVI